MRKNLIYMLCLFAALMLLCACGAEREVSVDAQEPPADVPSFRLIKRIRYTLCSHCIDNTKIIYARPMDKLEEIKRMYGGYSIEAGEDILLVREVPQYCPAHYILTLYDGRCCVYRNTSGGQTLERICICRYPPEILQESFRLRLIDGIAFDSIEELTDACERHKK